MYRSDQEALLQRADATTKEAEQLRRENEAMRQAMSQGLVHQAPPTYIAMQPNMIYAPMFDVRMLPMSERARLANHSIERTPVWAAAILNVITFGLYGLIHFGNLHDRLPHAAHNDPSAGKAIGFQFIPYFNLYWIFFSTRRLNDRLSLQLKLRGLPDTAPRGFTLATVICSMIPYIGWFVLGPIMWLINTCFLQSTVNRVPALPPTQWDASTR